MHELNMQEVNDVAGAGIAYYVGYAVGYAINWSRVPPDEFTWIG